MSGGMKEAELRAAATCGLCRRKIGESGIPLFWRVRVERFGLDAQALRRQQGLGLMVGGALAAVMGPDEDLAKPVMSAVTLTVCEPCGTKETMVAILAEAGSTS